MLSGVPRLPDDLRWLFWNAELADLDTDVHADGIIARALEHGDMSAVRWVLDTYGEERIHAFLRDVGHPELSEPTTIFWRAYFRAEEEQWATTPWRRSSAAHLPR